MPCDLSREEQLLREGSGPIAGIDEAGRGPLAGPVVAAAVILPAGFRLEGLDDSKKLAGSKRGRLFEALTSDHRVHSATGIAGVDEIDALNILKATFLAMRRALEALPVRPRHALVDGLPVQGLPVPHTALVGGDGLSASIAAASIIAKVTRDRIMGELDRIHPGYGFARHKGYGVREHLEALRQHGPCPVHRRSFAPVARATAETRPARTS